MSEVWGVSLSGREGGGILRRRGYSNEPRIITLRYPAVCAETGKPMAKGEDAVYYPSGPKGRNVFHPDSRQAQEFREMKADDAMAGVMW